MEKNIKVYRNLFIILCLLLVILCFIGIFTDGYKYKRINVLEETIEVQDEMIKRRDKTINIQDTLINRYQTLIIKIIKDE